MSVAASSIMKVPKILGSASFRAFRCLWMLEELGLPYEHVPVSPQSPEVKQYNPLGKVPVLVEEDGFVLYESGAILTYLGDKYSNATTSPLVPKAGTQERGLYEQTMSVLLTEMDAQGLWIHRKHEAMGQFFGFVPDAVTHAQKYFSKTNRVLKRQLKETHGPFLLGCGFTAVDIVYVHCLNWSKSIGWSDKWKDDETVQRYLERCKSRPAYVKCKMIRSKEQQKQHLSSTDSESKL